MANIAVINPPSPFLMDQRVFPNTGLVRVATALEKEHNVFFYDFAGEEDYLKGVRKIARDYDYYLFSSTTSQFPYTYKMFRELKNENPRAFTIIGGAHASAVSSLRERKIDDINIKTLDEFNTVFSGEGEEVSNIFKPGWQKGMLNHQIDDYPIPNFNYINLKSYKYDLLGQPTTSIQTQRGCPFPCEFCCGRNIDMYRKVRFHSPERVVREMDVLYDKYSFKSFMWYDDEINIIPGRLEKLCNLLKKRDYQHRGFVRSDLVVKHPHLIKKMAEAGFVKLCAGVESGSDRILSVINKRLTNQTNLEARKIIGDAGIHYEAFLIMGHPTETRKDLNMTIDFIKQAKPDDFDINILTPYPGCKIYDGAVPSNKYDGFAWEYNGLYFNKPDYSKEESYYKGPKGNAAVKIRTDDMNYDYLFKKRQEIQKLR